jgi:Ion channel
MAEENAQENQMEAPKASGKFLFLFAFLLVELLVYPYAGSGATIALWFRLLNVLIAISSVYAVSFQRVTWIFALVFAAPLVLDPFIRQEITFSKLELVRAGLSAAFDIFIVVIISRRVFSRREVTSDAIYGALSIYLLSGFAFSKIYSILAAFQNGAFYLDPVLNHHPQPLASDFTYYSFLTMTSLGAVGISPVSDQARSLSIVQSVLGILYLGVLVSRLIATYKPIQGSPERP